MIIGFVKMEVTGYFIKNYLSRVIFSKLIGVGRRENGSQYRQKKKAATGRGHGF